VKVDQRQVENSQAANLTLESADRLLLANKSH